MFRVQAGKDTFTPWIDNKIAGMEYIRREILTDLAYMFLEETSPFVPKSQYASGTLRESAYYLQKWGSFVTVDYLQITWSGLGNPNQEEFDWFENKQHDDYALSVYEGKTLYKGTKPTSQDWVTQGLEVFDTEYVEEILAEQLKIWFLK